MKLTAPGDWPVPDVQLFLFPIPKNITFFFLPLPPPPSRFLFFLIAGRFAPRCRIPNTKRIKFTTRDGRTPLRVNPVQRIRWPLNIVFYGDGDRWCGGGVGVGIRRATRVHNTPSALYRVSIISQGFCGENDVNPSSSSYRDRDDQFPRDDDVLRFGFFCITMRETRLTRFVFRPVIFFYSYYFVAMCVCIVYVCMSGDGGGGG